MTVTSRRFPLSVFKPALDKLGGCWYIEAEARLEIKNMVFLSYWRNKELHALSN